MKPIIENLRSPDRIKVVMLVAAVFCATAFAFSFVRRPVERLEQFPVHSAAPAAAATEVAATGAEQRAAPPPTPSSSTAADDASSDEPARGKRRADSKKSRGVRAHTAWPQVPPPVSAAIDAPASPAAPPPASAKADGVPAEGASSAVATRGRKFRRTF